jgi:hypothetical protein
MCVFWLTERRDFLSPLGEPIQLRVDAVRESRCAIARKVCAKRIRDLRDAPHACVVKRRVNARSVVVGGHEKPLFGKYRSRSHQPSAVERTMVSANSIATSVLLMRGVGRTS